MSVLLLMAGCDLLTGPGEIAGAHFAVEGIPALTPGDTLRLSVGGVDRDGSEVAAAPDRFSWSSTRPEAVEVLGPGRVRAGSALGEALVIARLEGGGADTARIWVQPPEEEPSHFRISVVFDDAVPDPWRAPILQAAETWQQVIRGPVPGVDLAGLDRTAGDCLARLEEAGLPVAGIEDGVRLFVLVSAADPHGYIAAVGGPCRQRDGHPTTLVGRVTILTSFSFQNLDTPSYDYFAMHEMGHALGLVGLVQDEDARWGSATEGEWRGPYAIEGLRRITGQVVEELPIFASHWGFTGDVMSNVRSVAVTPVSIGALMDLGYPAAWYSAGIR